jgi:hypothetical protein
MHAGLRRLRADALAQHDERSGGIPESFAYMPLKKLLVTYMPQKSFQTPVCHAINFCLRVCHFVHHLLELNGSTNLTSGTHMWK